MPSFSKRQSELDLEKVESSAKQHTDQQSLQPTLKGGFEFESSELT